MAAIAVPNFHGAQTRSKVTKTDADMHNMGVAINAYIVDNNEVLNVSGPGPTHPPTFWLGEESGPETMGNPPSTPVALTSEKPWDHFNMTPQSTIKQFAKNSWEGQIACMRDL